MGKLESKTKGGAAAVKQQKVAGGKAKVVAMKEEMSSKTKKVGGSGKKSKTPNFKFIIFDILQKILSDVDLKPV